MFESNDLYQRITKNNSITITILNAETQKPITNKTVSIVRRSGIMCIKGPCPQNEKIWQDLTDENGQIGIKEYDFKYNLHASIDGFEDGYIGRDVFTHQIITTVLMTPLD